RGSAQLQPVVNEAFLQDVAGLAKRLEEQFGTAPATSDGLLALRGVLEVPDAVEDEDARAELDAAILTCLKNGLANLQAARSSEGEALGLLLRGHLDAIAALCDRAEADPSRDPTSIRARLHDQVRLLMDTGAPLDEGRLHMEAAFLATKADIREEIDRLKTHIASGNDLLAAG